MLIESDNRDRERRLLADYEAIIGIVIEGLERRYGISLTTPITLPLSQACDQHQKLRKLIQFHPETCAKFDTKT